MAVTAISTNTIGAGTQFTFLAPGDSLIVLPNVTLGSTSASAILSSFGDVEVTVLGTLFCASQMTLIAGSSFTLGANATFGSFGANSANAALFLSGGAGIARIDGALTSLETLGILCSGGSNSVVVTGSVSAASAIFLGLNGDANDVVINSGIISANSESDAARDQRFNNGVFTEGADTRITNLATGTIAAISSEGAGVRVGLGGNGSSVTNAGAVISANYFAVDFANLDVTEVASLFNSGVINGHLGSFNGNDTTDSITNRGQMIGDVILNDGADVMDGRYGQVGGSVLGGIGDDTLDFRHGSVTGSISGDAGFDLIRGGDGGDQILGGADSDTLLGGAGDDSLDGGAGVDRIEGGDGDDDINGGTDGSELFGGRGNDLLTAIEDDTSTVSARGGDGDDTLRGNKNGDALSGNAGNDLITSGGGADDVRGGDGNDTISNGLGNDTVVGGAGDDDITGGGGNESLEGGAGNDSVIANNGTDVLRGGGGDDFLNGGGGVDQLVGGAGDDTLVGGAGGDNLTGDSGQDVFIFNDVSEIGTVAGARDVITDMFAGVDVIDLSAIDANTVAGGNQVFRYVGNVAFSNVAGQLIYSAATGLLQGDTNGDGTAEFAMFVQSHALLSASDFLL